MFETLNENDTQRLINAVNKLGSNNPKLIAQLEALAEIKENKPTIWKMALFKLGVK